MGRGSVVAEALEGAVSVDSGFAEQAVLDSIRTAARNNAIAFFMVLPSFLCFTDGFVGADDALDIHFQFIVYYSDRHKIETLCVEFPCRGVSL